MENGLAGFAASTLKIKMLNKCSIDLCLYFVDLNFYYAVIKAFFFLMLSCCCRVASFVVPDMKYVKNKK